MILWSPMPLEVVLAGWGSDAARRVELPIPGGWVIADVDADGKVAISRLVATDPRAYLEPRWRPGSILRAGAGSGDALGAAGRPEAGTGGTAGN
ncbi:MAG TPA: YlzJ-like family protein [Bacillota bacterium]|nr:YlzJ-like family protein [Bacillota bacterium]